MPESERSLAVFIDFENLALGFQGRRDRFDIARVLERLVEKGKIVAKRAYADWSRFAPYTAPLHEAAIELVEIPRRAQTGKNSADIHLCVDAMDLAANKEHIDTFVIVSGDSDFSPLVSKLKENGKHVIGLGMAESTSDLLRDNCDEFIYYDDLGKLPQATALNTQLPEAKLKAFALLLDSLTALRRENKEMLHSSMIKDTMKRKKPSFNESYHGYRSFSALLEDAQKEGVIQLETGKRSGTYVVTQFGEEMGSTPPVLPMSEERERRRRRRPSGRRRTKPPVDAAAPAEGNAAVAPREAAPREPAPREAAPREAAPREAAPREPAPREAAPREVASREPEPAVAPRVPARTLIAEREPPDDLTFPR